jgi:hypothetical protein
MNGQRNHTLLGAGLSLIFVLFLSTVTNANEEKEAKNAEPKSEKESVESVEDTAVSDLVIYVPTSRGRARTRSGGGTRGVGPSPTISVIAPDHEGLTTQAQPELHWYVSAATGDRIDFTLIDDVSEDPLIEVTLEGPVNKGLQVVRLADLGFSLVPETPYVWFVSLIPDPNRRSRDVTSGAAIRRVESPPKLLSDLETSESDFDAYAENGIWYDGIGVLGQDISRRPGDAQLRAQRAAFYRQVGLSSIADAIE